jgi:hypothetical protein
MQSLDFINHWITISRLLQRYQQFGSTADRQCSGQPSITSAAQDRYIRVLHLKNQTLTARETASNVGTDSKKPSQWKRLTRQTYLLWHSTEMSASTCKGPMVQQSKGLWPAKLEASLVQRWIKIHAAKRDGRTRVYRCRNERFTMNCVLEVDNFSGRSVMVWGAISYAW